MRWSIAGSSSANQFFSGVPEPRNPELQYQNTEMFCLAETTLCSYPLLKSVQEFRTKYLFTLYHSHCFRQTQRHECYLFWRTARYIGIGNASLCLSNLTP
jgi:hypothetical protein